jgi:hypothetical protein
MTEKALINNKFDLPVVLNALTDIMDDSSLATK